MGGGGSTARSLPSSSPSKTSNHKSVKKKGTRSSQSPAASLSPLKKHQSHHRSESNHVKGPPFPASSSGRTHQSVSSPDCATERNLSIECDDTLPFLKQKITTKNENDMKSEAKKESLSRERFRKVLHIVRTEKNALDGFNARRSHDRRKKQLAAQVASEVRKDREEANMKLREQLDDDAFREDLLEGRNMLFQMIGYELSSDDEDEDEVHDIHNAVDSNSDCIEEMKAESSPNSKGFDFAKNIMETLSSESEDACESENECRPASSTNQIDKDTSPIRKSSLLRNQEKVALTKKQFKLHTVMRQQSLEERQNRASRKLEERKRKSNTNKNKNRDIEEITPFEDKETFEARKNVIKTFKAHDHMRRDSVENRETKQRQALARRLEERKTQNSGAL